MSEKAPFCVLTAKLIHRAHSKKDHDWVLSTLMHEGLMGHDTAKEAGLFQVINHQDKFSLYGPGHTWLRFNQFASELGLELGRDD